MSVGTAKFTLDHYEHMINVGAFDGPYRKRVELIDGEILQMSPIGSEHSYVINLLNEWSWQVSNGREFKTRIQDPIRLPQLHSEPEPDVTWVRPNDYRSSHPSPEDVLLLIEVAESSLSFDQGKKKELYAQAGVADYWIVNLIDRQLEVYRQPQGADYASVTVIGADDEPTAPLVAPHAKLDLRLLLGE